MIVTRQTFSGQVIAAVQGQGFGPEAPIVFEFPTTMWLTGADLTPLKENIDKIVYGLTKWQPKITEKGVLSAGTNIKVTGKDYQNALDNLNILFLKNDWGDGLPIVPATKERVDWIMTGTDLKPDAKLGPGKILPVGGLATVQACAVALAMAGGRPEELPVLIAVVEALIDPAASHQSWVATTRACFAVVVVNGPVGRQVRLGTRYGVLGPIPKSPGSSTIGRALSFLIRIQGGCVPGSGSMAIFGFMRGTNAVFAEDEFGIKELTGWPTLAVERGFKPEDNVVTIFPSVTAHQTQFHQAFGPTPDLEEIQFLNRMAADLGAPGLIGGYIAASDNPNVYSGAFMISYNMARVLSDYGWDKKKVRDYVQEQMKPTWESLVKNGRVDPKATPTPVKNAPPMLLVAGGDQGNQGCAFMAYGGHTTTSAKVQLPAKWNDLLKQADTDLGPAPTIVNT